MKTKDRLCAALRANTKAREPAPGDPPVAEEVGEVVEKAGRGEDEPVPEEGEIEEVKPEPEEPEIYDPELDNRPESDDNRLAPVEKDWRVLEGYTNISYRRLMGDKRDINPLTCTIEVHRESPTFQNGRTIQCGHLAEYNCEWPFPKFNALLCEVGKRYGGGRYSFRTYDENHSLIRGRIMQIAGDSKNPAAATDPDAGAERHGLYADPTGGNGNGEPEPEGEEPEVEATEDGDLTGVAKREAQLTEIALLRQQRQEAQGSRRRSEASAPGPDPLQVFMAEVSRKLDEKKPDGEQSGLSLVLATMQASQQQMAQQMQAAQAQMQDSLKLVISSLGDKLAGQQSSQTEMFKLIAQMSESRSNATAEITKIQMEAKKSETDLMLKLMGEKREQQEMNLDKMLELIHMGMEMKGGGGGGGEGGEGEGEGDWLTKAISGLTGLISQKAMESTKIPEVNPDQPALPAPDAEQQQRFIEEAAARAAATIAKKARARDAQLRMRLAAQRNRMHAGAPAPAAPPPAPVSQPTPEQVEQYKRQVMQQVLVTVNAELDHPPQLSAAVKFVLQRATPDWKAKLVSTDNALELANFFRPYTDAATLAALGAKLKDNEPKQQWLMQQAGALRAYLIRLAKQQRPAATPPRPAEPELEKGVEPIPDEDSVEVTEGEVL